MESIIAERMSVMALRSRKGSNNLFSPEYACPFEWAEGSYHSSNGRIELSWEKKENKEGKLWETDELEM